VKERIIMRARIGPPAAGLAVLGLLLALGWGLAGCGGKSNDNGIASADGKAKAKATASAISSTDRHEAELKYAKCMRDHGVDMPDPDPNGPLTVKGHPGDEQAQQQAQEACKSFLPGGGDPPKLSPADVAKLQKYSKCMRQHGIDMPDPNAQGQVLQSAGPGSGDDKAGTMDMGPDNPQWAKADKSCHKLLPSGMGPQ
jgi:hypothetical protein